jgi:hypothetical protein
MWGLTLLLCAFGQQFGNDALGQDALGQDALGQDAPAREVSGQDGPVHTLHVYMDLIQIPVLVLDSHRQPMNPIDPSRFFVSLDSGPRFHPTHIRPEGEDPISLAILLDLSAPDPEWIPEVAEAISRLAPASLTARDRVTIYALDCSLVRSLNDVPASPEALKAGVDALVGPWMARRKEKHRPPCEQRVALWDSLVHMVKGLAVAPGRRVILAVTDGNDRGSRTKAPDLRLYTQSSGVAIFSIWPPWNRVTVERPDREGSFSTLSQTSGGMPVYAAPETASPTLERFVTMVRQRYILEFPRVRNGTAGQHEIVVTIAKSDAFIRPAGIAVPVQDPALASDPNTIPRDLSGAPELGTRRPTARSH